MTFTIRINGPGIELDIVVDNVVDLAIVEAVIAIIKCKLEDEES